MKKRFSASITIEASYIYPIIFLITTFAIIFSMNLHDLVISKSTQYRLLAYQACTLENNLYNPSNSLTKSDITSSIRDACLLKRSVILSTSLNDSVLYSHITNENLNTVFFSNYDHCDDIRKFHFIISN